MYLEPNEHIVCSLETEPPFKGAPLHELITTFSLYSSIFWLALLGNVFQAFSSGANETIIQRILLCLAGIMLIAYNVIKKYPRLKQSREESTLVITNTRLFRAPATSRLHQIRWDGPSHSTMWFEDTLSVEVGGHVTNPMLIFTQINPHHLRSEHVTLRHQIMTKARDEAFKMLPEYLKTFEVKHLPGETDTKFHQRISSVLADRNNLQGLRPHRQISPPK